MKPVILDVAGDGEPPPPYHWQIFRARAAGVRYGIVFYPGPEWAVHVDLGRWFIGIECTRDEDD